MWLVFYTLTTFTLLRLSCPRWLCQFSPPADSPTCHLPVWDLEASALQTNTVAQPLSPLTNQSNRALLNTWTPDRLHGDDNST